MTYLNILIVEGNLKEENKNFTDVGIPTHTDSLKQSLDSLQIKTNIAVVNPSSDKNMNSVTKNLSNFDLEFEVLNAVIAPSIHPTIRLRIKNVEKTQLYNVKF